MAFIYTYNAVKTLLPASINKTYVFFSIIQNITIAVFLEISWYITLRLYQPTLEKWRQVHYLYLYCPKHNRKADGKTNTKLMKDVKCECMQTPAQLPETDLQQTTKWWAVKLVASISTCACFYSTVSVLIAWNLFWSFLQLCFVLLA